MGYLSVGDRPVGGPAPAGSTEDDAAQQALAEQAARAEEERRKAEEERRKAEAAQRAAEAAAQAAAAAEAEKAANAQELKRSAEWASLAALAQEDRALKASKDANAAATAVNRPPPFPEAEGQDIFSARGSSRELQRKVLGTDIFASTQDRASNDAKRVQLATNAGPVQGAQMLQSLLNDNLDPDYRARLVDASKAPLAVVSSRSAALDPNDQRQVAQTLTEINASLPPEAQRTLTQALTVGAPDRIDPLSPDGFLTTAATPAPPPGSGDPMLEVGTRLAGRAVDTNLPPDQVAAANTIAADYLRAHPELTPETAQAAITNELMAQGIAVAGGSGPENQHARDDAAAAAVAADQVMPPDATAEQRRAAYEHARAKVAEYGGLGDAGITADALPEALYGAFYKAGLPVVSGQAGASDSVDAARYADRNLSVNATADERGRAYDEALVALRGGTFDTCADAEAAVRTRLAGLDPPVHLYDRTFDHQAADEVVDSMISPTASIDQRRAAYVAARQTVQQYGGAGDAGITADAEGLGPELARRLGPTGIPLLNPEQWLSPNAQRANVGLAETQAQATALQNRQPPDPAPVAIDNPASLSRDQLVQRWSDAMLAQRGTGDEAATRAFVEAHRQELGILGSVVSPTEEDRQNYAGDPHALYRPMIAELARRQPDAQISLVAIPGDDGSDLTDREVLDNQSQPHPLIAVTTQGADGQTQTQYYEVNPGRLRDDRQGQDESGVKQAIINAGLSDQWYQAAKNNPLARDYDQGNPEATMNASLGGQGKPNDAMLSVVLSMPPEQRDRIMAEYANLRPDRGDELMGGSLLKTDAPRGAPIAQVDVTDLAHGRQPAQLQSAVSIQGGEDKTHRQWHLLDQNYDTQVAPLMSQFLQRGDAPRELPGPSLENEIGTSLGLEPTRVPQTPEELRAANEGNFSYYDGKSKELMQPVVDQIHQVGGDDPKVTVLPVYFDSEETGQQQLSPLYRVQGRNGGEVFVDETGRSYDSFEAWKNDNKLPPGRVSYPRDGHLTQAEGRPGRADFVTEQTHAVPDTFSEHARLWGDRAALVGTAFVVGATVVSTGGVAAPLVGGAIAAYGVYQAADGINDLRNHGQSLNPVTNSSARSLWISLAANTAGVVALGSGAFASRVTASTAEAARASGEFSPAAQWLSQTSATFAGRASVTAQVLDTGAIANQAADLGANWGNLSAQQRATAVLQLGFWGANLKQQASQSGGVRNLYSASAIGNRVGFDPTRTGVIDYPGFPQDPAFGNMVTQTSRDAAGEISAGRINSADELWAFVSDRRRQFAETSDPTDFNNPNFGRPRAPEGLPAYTPLALENKYHAYVGRRLEENFPGSGTGPLRTAEIHGTLDGEDIVLTSIVWNENGAGVSAIQHTDPTKIPKVMEHVDELYQRALDPALPRDEFIKTAASIHWWLAQATPNARGSAASADTFVRTLFERRGIPAPAWGKNVVPDLEALTSNEASFVAQYQGFYSRTPR